MSDHGHVGRGQPVEDGQAPFAMVTGFLEVSLLSLCPAHECKRMGEDALVPESFGERARLLGVGKRFRPPARLGRGGSETAQGVGQLAQIPERF